MYYIKILAQKPVSHPVKEDYIKLHHSPRPTTIQRTGNNTRKRGTSWAKRRTPFVVWMKCV